MLEKRINIRAADYRFGDKKKYYKGFTNTKGQSKEGTRVVELVNLTSNSSDFTENDILERYTRIMNYFIKYLTENNLTV